MSIRKRNMRAKKRKRRRRGMMTSLRLREK
jgi:predicted DNA-binding ribbon-helix-helix protein